MSFSDWLSRQGGIIDQLRAAFEAGYKEGRADASRLCDPSHAADGERIRQLEAELLAALDVVETAQVTFAQRKPTKKLEIAIKRWAARRM